MNPLNPLNDPIVIYLRSMLGVRVHRLRSGEERSVGASAIEWAIITALLAAVAVGIGATIVNLIEKKAKSIKTE